MCSAATSRTSSPRPTRPHASTLARRRRRRRRGPTRRPPGRLYTVCPHAHTRTRLHTAHTPTPARTHTHTHPTQVQDHLVPLAAAVGRRVPQEATAASHASRAHGLALEATLRVQLRASYRVCGRHARRVRTHAQRGTTPHHTRVHAHARMAYSPAATHVVSPAPAQVHQHGGVHSVRMLQPVRHAPRLYGLCLPARHRPLRPVAARGQGDDQQDTQRARALGLALHRRHPAGEHEPRRLCLQARIGLHQRTHRQGDCASWPEADHHQARLLRRLPRRAVVCQDLLPAGLAGLLPL